jgi:hypothetical protein
MASLDKLRMKQLAATIPHPRMQAKGSFAANRTTDHTGTRRSSAWEPTPQRRVPASIHTCPHQSAVLSKTSSKFYHWSTGYRQMMFCNCNRFTSCISFINNLRICYIETGRSRVRVLMRWIFCNLPNPSGRTMPLGFDRNEYTRNQPGGKVRAARKAHNLPPSSSRLSK